MADNDWRPIGVTQTGGATTVHFAKGAPDGGWEIRGIPLDGFGRNGRVDPRDLRVEE